MSVPGWKNSFIRDTPWTFFDFDVMDAVDVEEVVLVVVGDQPFHLLRVHAAVGLADVDDRQVQGGEDVHLHPAEGQHAGEGDAGDQHHDRDRPAEGGGDRVHRLATQRVVEYRPLSNGRRPVVGPKRPSVNSVSWTVAGPMRQADSVDWNRGGVRRGHRGRVGRLDGLRVGRSRGLGTRRGWHGRRR